MSTQVDFYLSPISPWTFLGISRFRKLVARYDAAANYKPVHLGRIFETVNVAPVTKRPEAMQKHRLDELRRWRDFLEIPINLHPRHFPTDPTPACRLIAAAVLEGGDVAELCEACMAACWIHEEDIADRGTLIRVADRCGFDGTSLIEAANRAEALVLVDANTDEAIARSVIGTPTFVIGQEVLFGQDRLDFVERELQGAS